MPAPQGEAFTAIVNGVELEVVIEPTIFARRSQDALCRVYRKKVRENVWEDIKALSQTDLDPITKAEIKQEYASILKKASMPSVQEAMEVMSTPDGMIVALEMNSNLDHVQAKQLVDTAPNLTDLAIKLFSVAKEEHDEAGN